MPEYAEVIGVPFEFMPVKNPEDDPVPPKPRYEVRSVRGRRDCCIEFPNVEHYLTDTGSAGFRLDPERVRRWVPVGASETVLSGTVGGETTLSAQQRNIRRQRAETLLAAGVVQRWQQRLSDGGEGRRARRRTLFYNAMSVVKDWAKLAEVADSDYDAAASSHLAQAVVAIDDAAVPSQ